MCIYVYAGTINRPLRLLTVCDNVANTLQNTNVHLRNWLQNIPSGVGTDSSCPYPNIANCTYLHYQIRISPPHYVCVYVYAGAINRPLQLLTVCQLRGEHSAKHSTYTYEMGCEHSVRRRGRFIAPVS